MDLRPLGTTGILVSPLGLGTVKLGRNQAVKYPEPFDLPTDDEARALLELAAELGMNLLDTAPAYGNSEERLGGLLASTRDRWVISTKVGEDFDVGPDGPRSRHNFSAAHTRASVERSLQRLRTDHLDIVLVHSDGSEDDQPALEALSALADLKREGKTRAIGFSPKTVAGARVALSLSDVLMLTLNAAEPEMLPVVRQAHAARVGVLIKKGLRSGHLSTADGGEHSAETCLRYLFAEPSISSVVVGSTNPAHLRQNTAVIGRLSAF